MNYMDYQSSRNASWQLLIDLKIKELPIKITDLCRKIGILVKSIPLEQDVDGFSLMQDETPIIIVNANKSENISRLRFTVAHELGHIILGHVGQFELVNREPSPSDNPIERDANIFASRLLAPACVLWGCNVQTSEDVMKLCGISHQAAEYRMNRMRVLYARNKFLTHPLERKVFRQFKRFIKGYKSKK